MTVRAAERLALRRAGRGIDLDTGATFPVITRLGKMGTLRKIYFLLDPQGDQS
jgi:hypothetical protein